jgi:hypothetical protein
MIAKNLLLTYRIMKRLSIGGVVLRMLQVALPSQFIAFPLSVIDDACKAEVLISF